MIHLLKNNHWRVCCDSIRVTEIMKEKDELQQINERMWDMPTEKELENDELDKKLENYKFKVKTEN